ncbi:hypothetical protein PEC730217_15470 [Pectobacterium carotovorum subsp. carotovorum]|nr:Hypothetical protein SCC1_3760 [Pectobacterium versatile]MBK4824555.1 hypothetical protein [Pectobacterium carotovorum subsp. carotovorum]POY54074.1 hypothetical protein F018LOC_02335 [Pectobacterium versatile]PVY72176.1 hypothetical protein C7330_1232 [Pectobacterium versatile]RUR89920.1 hypothetical protein PB16LOC_03756 [Pectobacterium versatile]
MWLSCKGLVYYGVTTGECIDELYDGTSYSYWYD